VMLSSFSNDLPELNLPMWVSPHQSNVMLSSFSNDLPELNLPIWVSPHQSDVMLSSFSNDLPELNLPMWVSPHQSNVMLSSFSNDLPELNLPMWVKHCQSEVNLAGFNNDLVVNWDIDDNSTKVKLSKFMNNIAPWLREDQSNVMLSSFSNDLDALNLPMWVSPHQSNVMLSSFSNDIVFTVEDLANTIMQTSSNILLSSFSNDLNQEECLMNMSNMYLSDQVHINSDENLVTVLNDIRVIGTLFCDLIMVSPWEDTSIITTALNNLDTYMLFDSGFKTDGIIATKHENVFTKPTYFTDNVYFSSNVYANIKPDPFFRESVEIMSNLRVHGKIVGTNTAFIELNNENIEIGHELVVDTISNQVSVSNNLTVGGSSILNSLTVINSTHLLGEVFGSDTSGILFMDDVHFTKPINSRVEANMHNGINIHDTDVDTGSYWKIYGSTTTTDKELIFKSHNNIVTSFTDSFHPGVMNFTGKHRCTGRFNKKEMEDLVGKIVISTGEYSDLNNEKILTINEAIPIVSLCKFENDKRCFGVVSDRESDDDQSEFKLGNLKFHMQKKRRSKKYMINSVGEGGIWVCDIGGNMYNGDYISSSSLPGFGMKQTSTFHLNYTVAKITCDCDFDNIPSTVKQKEVVYKSKLVKCAFVGCVYKF
jgi:hypothetical protein